ncbi:hypothetical protein HPP92_009397 [Vanilla planifolia]|uniref:Uncharacterized protein n=1 Tax=Vanilla planifolia TaxID=51239 RepID=A0A835RJU2_VANPL|nr:hypothetical protein HPP92_009397 [Vanilla planifolia]
MAPHLRSVDTIRSPCFLLVSTGQAPAAARRRFFVALLAACLSFVIAGGFLFYKFRNKKQSLKIVLGSLGLSLLIASLFAQQRTRFERILGLVSYLGY